MRLFIAINFPEEVKREIADIQNQLKEHGLSGNFTLFENLHLTLVFLGEVRPDRINALRRIMDCAAAPAFRISMSGIGSFRRYGGDIWWMGIEENASLAGLHGKLSEELDGEGFEVELRKFTQHLTLAREVRLKEDFDPAAFSRGISAVSSEVSKISLMKSERIGGRLVYTEIYGRTLAP